MLRGGRVLIAIGGGACVLAVASGLLESRFISPRQVAAEAQPPRAIEVTAPVAFGVLNASVALRAQVTDANPIQVGLPDDLGSSLPVVTGREAAAGSTVQEGEVVVSIAERPIIVLEGQIPAFRDMTFGDRGVDVVQLQAALQRLGYSTAPDPNGLYGAGTSRAVASWYTALGYSFASTTSTTGATSATVPRGEVVFVPNLPARVIASSASIGAELSTKQPVMTIGSGQVVLHGEVGAADLPNVRVGETAVATSDVTGSAFKAEVSSVSGSPSSSPTTNVPTYPVDLTPQVPITQGLVGQNVGVVISTASSKTPTWIVPVAAVTTASSGSSFVEVRTSRNRSRSVAVKPGLVSGGREAIEPVRGGLRGGESVVVGVSTSGTP